MTNPTPDTPAAEPASTPAPPQKPTEAEEDSTSGKRTDIESGVDTGALEPGRSGQNGKFAG